MLQPQEIDPAYLSENFTIKQLTAIAGEYGLAVDAKAKKDQIIQALIPAAIALQPGAPAPASSAPAEPAPANAFVEPAAPAAPIVGSDTFEKAKDAVLEGLAPYMKAGLQVKFDEPSCTFHMRNGKHEDSGTLKQPVVAIVRCAFKMMPHVGRPAA